jgi:ribosome maturation factor RimP
MSKITNLVTELAKPAALELDVEIWDVEYVKEAGTNYLRVFIDRPEGGISIEDCEKFSRIVDPLLDEADPIPDSYVFEVSSAGAERALRRPSDFERFMGSFAEVRLFAPYLGGKSHIGQLTAYDGGDVSLNINGETIIFEKSKIAQVRLRIV